MARSIASGLELSWHGPSKRWYRTVTLSGKSKRIYFGSGQNKSDRKSYREALEKYKQWESERQIAKSIAQVVKRIQAVDDGQEPVSSLGGTPAEQIYLQKLMSYEVDADGYVVPPAEEVHAPDLSDDDLQEQLEQVDPKSDRLARLAMLQLTYAKDSAKRKADPKAGKTITDHVDAWLEAEKGRLDAGQLSQAGYTSKVNGIKTFRDWVNGDCFNGPERTEQILTAYKAMLLTKRASGEYTGHTVNDKTKFARQFVNWCYKQRILAELPRTLDDLVKRVDVQKGGKPLTVTQVRALWEAAGDRMKCFIALGLNCGFKNKDITDIKAEELQGDRLVAKRGKTGVPMNYKLWPETLRLIRNCRDRSEAAGRVFTDSGGGPLNPGTVGALFKKVARRAGVVVGKNKKGDDAFATFEQLRDTSAELIRQAILKEGIDMGLLQVFLAHKDKSTAAYYTSDDPATMRTDKLDGMVMALAEKYELEV